MFEKNARKSKLTSTTCFSDALKKAAAAIYSIDRNNSELAERYVEP